MPPPAENDFLEAAVAADDRSKKSYVYAAYLHLCQPELCALLRGGEASAVLDAFCEWRLMSFASGH